MRRSGGADPTRGPLKRALVIPSGALSIWLFAELLFLHAVGLPTMREVLAAAYRGEAHPLVNMLFQRVATDAYKTPLWMYQDKLTYAYEAMKVPVLVFVLGATGFLWLSTRHQNAALAIRDWPQRLGYLVSWFLLLPLLVYAKLGTYTRFMADDYCFAAAARTMGMIGGFVHMYLTWNGRYSELFLGSLAGALGPNPVPFGTGVMLLMWFSATAFALYQLGLAQRQLARLFLAALLSAALVFSTAQLSFHLVQSLYWGSASRYSLPPLMLLAVCLGILKYRLTHSQPSRCSWLWGLAASGLTFVAGGFNETFSALQVSAWAMLMLGAVICAPGGLRNRILREAAPLLLGSLAALAVIAVAPGTDVRLGILSPAPTLTAMLEIAWASTCDFLRWAFFSWQRSLSLLALMLLSMLISTGRFGGHVPLIARTQTARRVLVLLPGATLVLLYSCFVPAAFAMGGSPPGRILIIPGFVLVCAAAWLGLILGQLVALDFNRPRLAIPRSILGVVSLCVLVLYLVLACQAVYDQLRLLRPFARYAEAWDANEVLIRAAQAQGDDHVTVATLPANWWGLDGRDFGPDPSFWVNECAGRYYGVQIIALPHETD